MTWQCKALTVSATLALATIIGSCSPDATQAQTPDRPDAGEIVGVASVIDGDTIEIHGTHIRLSGFDAPEHGSMCGATNVYQRASLALSDFIGSQSVHCTPDGTETHGRTVATCTVGDTELGHHMVSEGWARDWPRFSHGAYAGDEARARAAQRGIWGLDCPTTLWGNRNYSTR